MILIPKPEKITEYGSFYKTGADAVIILSPECGFPDFESAKLLKEEMLRGTSAEIEIGKSSDDGGSAVFIRNDNSPDESYSLNIDGNGARISGGSRGIFWGVQTMRQIIRQCGGAWPYVSIEDSPQFRNRGFYHDVTRGKVPKLETLKELADRLSFYKINELQLYIEHSFAFKGFSEAWMGKDPLKAEEILELDEYCRKKQIELVPSMATFGHLYEVLVTKTWRRCSELEISGTVPFSWHDRMAHHTLDATNEESFRLVRSMLDQYMPLFSSDKFNVCCDETFDIGKGKTADLAEKVGTGRIYVDFLKKIMNYVQSRGKKVMFWGDIILKSPEFIRELPKDAECLFWNYGWDFDETDVKTIADSGLKFYVCPGVSGWNLLMNRFDYAYKNIAKIVKAGRRYGADGLLNTDWGDFGHINLFANSMPGMALGAALSWNPDDARDLTRFLEDYSTVEYGKQMSGLGGLLNELSLQQTGTWAFIVCWRERRLVDNEFCNDRVREVEQMDPGEAMKGFRRALEIERELTVLPGGGVNRTDLEEFVCAARGIALFNAACLAIKKYDFGFPQTPLAMGCGELAVQIEYWFASFAKVWRVRNQESELYRIRATLQDLCSFLRDHASL